MVAEEPYFLKNEKWFYFDANDFMYKLTDEAPEEAKRSYKEFYSQVYGGTGNE